MFALLPLEGEALLIVTPHEAYVCEKDSWITNIRTFPPVHSHQGVDVITDAVCELGLEEGCIGAELGGMVPLRMPHQDFGQLRRNLPRVDFVDVSEICFALRARKSGPEVERIRQAVAITDTAYEVLFQQVNPGMTEQELWRLLALEHLKGGAEMPGSISLSPFIPGDDRACDRTLRRPTERVLTTGEMITAGCGGHLSGLLV